MAGNGVQMLHGCGGVQVVMAPQDDESTVNETKNSMFGFEVITMLSAFLPSSYLIIWVDFQVVFQWKGEQRGC